MLITIRTLNAQRKITIENLEELEQKIKTTFKTEEYKLYSDPEKTKKLEIDDIKDNMMVYMDYDIGEAKEYKEEVKCTHSPEAVCPKCVNLERSTRISPPGENVKYVSYASYIQALDDRGVSEDDFDYEVKTCEEHPANQKCSRCVEKQITLLSQLYRHIDYVEFDSKAMIEEFFLGWKSSWRQKIGLLVGTYAEYAKSPLGKKAIVSGIWEIEQECFPDGVALNSIPEKFIINELKILGVIYTDFKQDKNEATSNKVLENYIISTSEIDFINHLKQKIGNPAFFGICLSFNEEKDIIPKVFMVTEQYEALKKADALSLTTSPTEFKANREIVYHVRNEYDKLVPKQADPLLPVYYFVVTCETGFKENPMFPIMCKIAKPTYKKLSEYFESKIELEKFRNFNILVALQKFLPKLTEDLFKAAIRNDKKLFEAVTEEPDFQKFVEELTKHENKKWDCASCTYLNEAIRSSCELCAAPKPQ
ncbi:Nuclear protein localization protein 4 [Glugoides intestinalis]